MIMGTIAGMLMEDLIVGNRNPWEEIYAPNRFRLRATGELMKNGMKVMSDVAKDYVGPGEVKGEADVKAGHGAIMRKGIKKIALYRDPKGTLFARSAICPHRGCVVHWNDNEKSWDCPCHGSRFNATGEVLNGPTKKNLATLDSERSRSDLKSQSRRIRVIDLFFPSLHGKLQ